MTRLWANWLSFQNFSIYSRFQLKVLSYVTRFETTINEDQNVQQNIHEERGIVMCLETYRFSCAILLDAFDATIWLMFCVICSCFVPVKRSKRNRNDDEKLFFFPKNWQDLEWILSNRLKWAVKNILTCFRCQLMTETLKKVVICVILGVNNNTTKLSQFT